MTIQPQLAVRRGPEALAFYQAAFGAVVEHLVGDDHIVAQLSVNGASFWISDEAPEHGSFSPETLEGATTKLLLVAVDPQATIDQAVRAGATQISPATDEHGWLLGRIKDPYGHFWEIGKPLGAWPPA